MAVGAHYLLGLRWELAVLLGAVTSPTDAAAVFSVLRRVPLPRAAHRRARGRVRPQRRPDRACWSRWSRTGAVARPRRARHRRASSSSSWSPAWLVGLAVGFGGAWVMRRVGAAVLRPLPARRAVADVPRVRAARRPLHASGFAAVYVAALVLGNSELPHRAATRSFAEGVAWLAQIGLFVMLGLLRLAGPDHACDTSGSASLAGLLLTFVARPLSVLVSALVAADAVARAGVPVLGRAARRGADRARHDPAGRGRRRAPSELFDIVFVMVVIYTLLTGPTLPWVAARARGRPARASRATSRSRRRRWSGSRPTCCRSRSRRRSRLHGVEVGELRLPVGRLGRRWSSATGSTLVPERRTVLRHGDDLLVVTPRKLREATEQRLRAVSLRRPAGALAGRRAAAEPR